MNNNPSTSKNIHPGTNNMTTQGQHMMTKGSNANMVNPNSIEKIKNKYNTIDNGAPGAASQYGSTH